MDKNTPTEERKNATVYIGVVGSEIEHGPCSDSIWNLNIRKGDRSPQYARATKGFDGRNAHINQFLKSEYDAILMLDGDMMFAPNTLELLRNNGMPYVSGYYMRRQIRPIAPVMFEWNEHDEWPMEPMFRDPDPYKLHRIGASGWGCVLIHREVFEAVGPLLKGEAFVIEDDMDVWPYDLEKMVQLIKTVRTAKTIKEAHKAGDELAEEFKPLRGMKDNIGSDIRFPFFAKQAGYALYLDPSVRPGHVYNYPITPDDFKAACEAGSQEREKEETMNHVSFNRKIWNDLMKGLRE